MIHILGSATLLLYFALVLVSGEGSPTRVVAGLTVWLLAFLPYAWLTRRALQQADPIRSAPSFWKLSTPILLWALLFRLALVPAGINVDRPLESFKLDLGAEEAGYQPFLLWDNDAWRYLWDGHMVMNGRSPYTTAPTTVIEASDRGESWADDLLEEGPWWDVLDRISYGDFRTVYPPLALGLFTTAHWIAPGSVLVWKLLLVAIESAGCLLFFALLRRLGKHPEIGLVLAWNPLLIKEVAGSGHVDGALVTALVVALLAVAYRRNTLAVGAVTAAVLLKLWPLALAPAILVRTRWTNWWPLPLGLAASYWPFRHELADLASAFRAFSSQWVFNPGPWLAGEQIGLALGFEGRGLPDFLHFGLAGTAVALTTWLAHQHRSVARPSALTVARDWAWIASFFLFFSATVMPWYLVSLLPLAALLGCWPILVAGAASILSYLIYATGSESGWTLLIEYSVIVAAFSVWFRQRSKRLSPELNYEGPGSSP